MGLNVIRGPALTIGKDAVTQPFPVEAPSGPSYSFGVWNAQLADAQMIAGGIYIASDLFLTFTFPQNPADGETVGVYSERSPTIAAADPSQPIYCDYPEPITTSRTLVDGADVLRIWQWSSTLARWVQVVRMQVNNAVARGLVPNNAGSNLYAERQNLMTDAGNYGVPDPLFGMTFSVRREAAAGAIVDGRSLGDLLDPITGAAAGTIDTTAWNQYATCTWQWDGLLWSVVHWWPAGP